MRGTWLGVALAACGTLLAAEPASADVGIVDCASATLPRDRLICASSELAPYRDAMARLYESTRADLSGEGRRLVDESQRSWLAYMHTVCPADEPCLESAYGDGLEWLQSADMTPFASDDFRFQAVGRYEARAVDGGPALFRRIVVLPRIDDPVTPETARWNRLVAQRIEAFVDRNSGPDSLTNFGIEYVSRDVISLYIFLDNNFHGGNFHGELKSLGYTVLLASGRKLEAADLFDGRRPWKAFLAQQVHAALQQTVTRNGGELKAKDASEIEDLVADDERWSIDGSGLSLHLDDTVADDRSGPQDVTVAWTLLAPYLVSPPPFPIPQGGRGGVR